MIFSFVKDYLKHRLTSKKLNKQHSTFVDDLLNKVIYDKTHDPVYADIETHKRGILPNSRRRGNRPKADQLLFRLARYFKPHRVVELGTGRGISRMYLNRALPDAHITSLEQDGSINHNTNKLKHIDMAFINYYKPDELLNAFELLLPKFDPESVLVICNVYGDPKAKQSFQNIKIHPKVTGTIDLFWLQLVFFRESENKEHFRLRF